MKLVKGWVPLWRKKDNICREKLVTGYKDQLNSLWHIMHFLRLNRLCQNSAWRLSAGQRMLFHTYIKDFNIQVEIPFINRHKQNRTPLTTYFAKHGTQGETDMPKSILLKVKFVLFWLESICLAFHLCQGLPKKETEKNFTKESQFYLTCSEKMQLINFTIHFVNF